jgi:GT2 family glycosyltransferase
MLSLIIATYDRPEMLLRCCQSLQQQEGVADVEVIVVNNGEVGTLADIEKEFSSFQFIHEPQRGLSLTRNKGAAAATGEYLVFLDDDVQFPTGFIRMAQEVAASQAYVAFGGSYRAWYPYGKPKWLSDDFGTKQALRSDRGLIVPGQDGFLSGGIFACRKAVYWEVGGFSPQLGMRQQLGYGEEDDLQLRLHAAGFPIGFIPDWWLQHAVLPHKWSLRWQWASASARRRDRAHGTPLEVGSLSLGSLRTLLATLFKVPLLLGKWIFSPGYYWQNMLLDLGIPLARRWGDWQAYFKQ